MTIETPAPEPDDAARPGQSLAAELLTAAPVPATTAAPVASVPKLPPFQGD